MKILQNIFNLGINSSVWVALSVGALIAITYSNFKLELHDNMIVVIFSGTVFGYNFIKYFEKVQLSGIKITLLKLSLSCVLERFIRLKRHEKSTFFISVLSLLICIAFAFQLKLETLLVLIIPMLFSFFYAVSFGQKTLRNISGLKIYVVALVWAFVTVLVPILESEINITADVWVTFVQRFLFVVVLMLPFEIRDLAVDDIKLRTLPQKIGVKKTKLFGMSLLVLFFTLEFLKDELLEINILSLAVITLITAFFLIGSVKEQSKYYASFFVEGVPILWLLLLLIL